MSGCWVAVHLLCKIWASCALHFASLEEEGEEDRSRKKEEAAEGEGRSRKERLALADTTEVVQAMSDARPPYLLKYLSYFILRWHLS